MHINAIAVANYFIQLSAEKEVPIRLLGLIKRVYIAHGFSLALCNKSLLDDRFDVVEAWKFGPVIPSVYHTFKYNRENPISDLGEIFEGYDANGSQIFVEPHLEDDEAKQICEMVWNRYRSFSDFDLVALLHAKGSPWFWAYEEGRNNLIDDEITKQHYKRVVEYVTQGVSR